MLAELPNDLGLKELTRIAQRHATEDVRHEAVERLGVKACDDAIATLLAVIGGDRDPALQREAVSALAGTYSWRRSRQGEIRGMLEQIAQSHPSSAVRGRAFKELQELGAERVSG